MPTLQQFPSRVSSLDLTRLRPHTITGYIISFLRQKFQEHNNINDPYLRKPAIEYRPDDLQNERITTGILIDTSYKWKPENAQQRPAIIVKRGSYDLDPRTSIGSKRHAVTNLVGSVNQNVAGTLGDEQFHNFISGSHAILCISKEGAASEALGVEIWNDFMDFEALLRRDLRLSRFRVGSLPETGKLRESQELWVTPVVISYTYQVETIVYGQSPLIKSIDLTVNSE